MNRAIDTHCHVNFQAFAADRKTIIEATLKQGVDMIIVGTDLETSRSAVELAKQYSGVYAAVGFHPIHVLDRDWRSELIKISEIIDQPKVVAVGEIGFDRYRMPEKDLDNIIKVQNTVFEFLCLEAKKHSKPIILHNRDAMDLLEEKFSWFKEIGITGVQHCFPGNLEQAEKLFAIGFKVGFTGLITYNEKWDSLISQLPLEQILIETDSPYLTPVPKRGERNTPANVLFVAKHISKLKGMDKDSIINQTRINANQLFNLKA